jgi:hypothetical protein
MRVQFEIDEGDYVRAAKLVDRFSRPVLWYLLPYFLVLIPVLFVLWSKIRTGVYRFGLNDLLLFLPAFVVLVLYFGFNLYSHFQKRREYWESEDLQKEMTVRIDENGILREGEGFMENMSWDAADWWKEDDRIILICVPAYSMVIVPKRAMDSENEYTSLMLLLADKIGPPK